MNPSQAAINFYHEWYADQVSHSITFLGVPIMKWVGDLWTYQQIIFLMKPALIIEFGTGCGGSALWFAELMRYVNPVGIVATFDIDITYVDDRVKNHPGIRCMQWDTANPTLIERLRGLRQAFPGPVFIILDSDHKKAHVLAEMELLRGVLKDGDYLVVEDGNINGHPIYGGWGEGPFEALQEYEQRYPNDYEHDRVNERRFGFTFATEGYLIPK
jgi:cephalosporin hydroxylase